jgi:hypothetical protein
MLSDSGAAQPTQILMQRGSGERLGRYFGDADTNIKKILLIRALLFSKKMYIRKKRIHKNRKFDQSKIGLPYIMGERVIIIYKC